MNENNSTSPAPRHLAQLESFYAAEMRYVAAGGFAAGADFTEMAAHLHPQVVAHLGPSVPYSGDWVGVDGIERFFAAYTETWSSLDLSDVSYFEGETGVAISLRMKATALRSGKTLDARIGQFLTFEDGLIRDITVFYLDPVQATEVTLP